MLVKDIRIKVVVPMTITRAEDSGDFDFSVTVSPGMRLVDLKNLAMPDEKTLMAVAVFTEDSDHYPLEEGTDDSNTAGA